MPALIEAGVSNQQLLAVWSAKADTGFTPTQLLAAGISIAEMRSNSIPDYLLFNQVCNPQLSNGIPPGPTVKLLSTSLSPTNTQVVLGAETENIIRILWDKETNSIQFIRMANVPPLSASNENSNIEAFYLRDEGDRLIVEIHISLPRVFSTTNFTVFIEDNFGTRVSLQLCSE